MHGTPASNAVCSTVPLSHGAALPLTLPACRRMQPTGPAGTLADVPLQVSLAAALLREERLRCATGRLFGRKIKSTFWMAEAVTGAAPCPCCERSRSMEAVQREFNDSRTCCSSISRSKATWLAYVPTREAACHRVCTRQGLQGRGAVRAPARGWVEMAAARP